MTSWFTLGALGSNPKAEAYGAMAKALSQSRGTKHYYHFPPHDDRHPYPSHRIRQHDNPFKENMPWIRWRWIIHDFRLFGLKGALRKHYYIGEQWRRKDEKIFCGMDENGNKYWSARRSRGSWQGRFFEPADPHWFRGQDQHTVDAMHTKWLTGGAAHTPEQIQARGEWGHNSRMGIPMPFNIRHRPWGLLHHQVQFLRDPSMIPGPGHPVNPQYKLMLEAGFTKWGVTNKAQPTHMPFMGLHDFGEDVEEEFHRTQSVFARANRGGDHDEWRA